MMTFPLLTHTRAEDLLAFGHGKSVSVARFLADVRQLVHALPAGKHVLNVCADRYRFAVGVAACLLANKISLLPPTLTPEMVRQIKCFAPDAFCLADQPQTLDLPQFSWASAMTQPAPLADAAQTGPVDIPAIPAAQPAVIMFTSGTTGAPLAHCKKWGEVVQSVRAEAERLGLLDGRRHSIVATVPPQHMYGFESSVVLAWQSGAAMGAAHPFYPADICAALAEAPQPCLLVTTPVHLKVLLAADLDIPLPALVLSATAPLSPQLALAVEARLQAPLFEIYGSTETGQIASRRTTQATQWTLLPGVKLTARQNQVWASGGHLERPLVLNDELELLSEERFLLHGRTADLINIAGKRSSLGYLNHQLNAVPGVLDGAFFVPDDEDDKVIRPMAFAVAPGLTTAALLAALRERIDAVFMPRPLVLLPSLPRNSTGKVLRATLESLAREHGKKASRGR